MFHPVAPRGGMRVPSGRRGKVLVSAGVAERKTQGT